MLRQAGCVPRNRVTRSVRFGPDYYVGEPVFAPDTAVAMDSTGMEDPGEVLEGRRETSSHGWWQAG